MFIVADWSNFRLAALFIFLNLFYLFIFGCVGLRCCVPAFSSCGERGLLLVVVRGLLVAVASLVAEHGLEACGLTNCGSLALERRLSSCGTRALLLHGLWDLPGPGLKPASPALAGGFLTTAPPGKPRIAALKCLFDNFNIHVISVLASADCSCSVDLRFS